MYKKEAWHPGPIEDNTGPKVFDVYKAYSDRLGVLRTVAALTIPIVLFSMKMIVDGGSKDNITVACGYTIAALMVIAVVFLRVKANSLISDYEKLITKEQREAFRLLPLDSLMSAETYFKRGTEISKFWTFTVILCWLGGVASSSTLLLTVLWL